jgi:peptide/nickel transport system ATP-binding protein
VAAICDVPELKNTWAETRTCAIRSLPNILTPASDTMAANASLVSSVSTLLEVDGLRVSFLTPQGAVRVLDGVSFSVSPGRLTGLVGESGSGKTVSVLSIMRLLPENARVTGGSITFDGQDLLRLSEAEMRAVRGARIAMIFQEPMTSLNPVFTIGSQVGEAIRLHQRTNRRETRARTVEALRMVGIADPEHRVNDYPHQLSGGMRQRVMIAMALACNPKLLIADEPTTALDVTIQAQILDLIRDLQSRLGLAVILVTHDLGVVAQYADDVTILYAARVMERTSAAELFHHPLCPYTKALFAALPGIDGGQRRLQAIPGVVPSAMNPPAGCRFHPRCPIAIEDCSRVNPPLEEKAPGHYVSCIRV